MTNHTRIEALNRRLRDERRRIVEAAANTDMLPPAGLLSHLSNLDRAISAVEAVMDERTALPPSMVGPVRAASELGEAFA